MISADSGSWFLIYLPASHSWTILIIMIVMRFGSIGLSYNTGAISHLHCHVPTCTIMHGLTYGLVSYFRFSSLLFS